MFSRKNHRNGRAPTVQLLGADSINTQGYHGHIGDHVRIEPYALFKVDKVLVAISAERTGLVEHGLTTLEPGIGQWPYTATAENPEKDDGSVAVTAFRERVGFWKCVGAAIGQCNDRGPAPGDRAGANCPA
jgi:hypothetical protein